MNNKRMIQAGCGCLVSTILLFACQTAFADSRVQVILQDGNLQPPTIQVGQDDTLHIDIVNKGSQVHNFVIPDFYIFTSNLNPGEHTTVQFQPSKSGSYPYYSDKKGVPESGMHGTLTVTP